MVGAVGRCVASAFPADLPRGLQAVVAATISGWAGTAPRHKIQAAGPLLFNADSGGPTDP